MVPGLLCVCILSELSLSLGQVCISYIVVGFNSFLSVTVFLHRYQLLGIVFGWGGERESEIKWGNHQGTGESARMTKSNLYKYTNL